MAATLSCTCGKVAIQLAMKPVRRLGCCCMDCRHAFRWCASTSSTTTTTSPTTAIKAPPVPLINDAVYFPNALQVTSGVEYLGCYMIKHGYDTRRIVAKCCWTCLMGDHPAYQFKRFITFANVAKLELQSPTQLPPVTKRIFEDDLTPDQLASLQQFVPPEPLPQWPPDPKDIDTTSYIQSGSFMTIQTLIDDVLQGRLEIMDPDYKGKPTSWSKKQGNSK